MTLKQLGYAAWLSAEDNGWHEPRRDENGLIRPTSTFERIGLIAVDDVDRLRAAGDYATGLAHLVEAKDHEA